MSSNQNYGQPGNASVKTMSILHLALLAGQVLFGVVIITITPEPKFDYQYTGDPLLFIVPVMAVASFATSGFLFRQQLEKAKAETALSLKLVGYQTALIIRLAVLEGVSLFGIVAFTLTTNLFFLLISALIVLYFITLRPTKNNITDSLELSMEEVMELK